METTQTIETKFDLFKTLYLIKTEQELLDVYDMGVKISIQTTITNAKNNLIGDETLIYLKDIFTHIILNNVKFLDKYNRVNSSKTLTAVTTNTIPPTPPIELSEKEYPIPRRYGKEKIVDDVKKDNRKLTVIERALISCNNIKNIHVNLERRLIHDLFVDREDIDGDKVLTDGECRDIIAIAELMTNKLKALLDKKVRSAAKRVKKD
jgi:hypothetical protein